MTYLQAKDQNLMVIFVGVFSIIKDELIRFGILLTYNLSFHDILICFELPPFVYYYN